ncbi:uncharacterized protein ColSpa_01461 [Colletotrichum spaethianum]|uniref:DUF7908 domain-containing protein n=1 Tax=Colletotrichum spaethianum TaxID=700344 RepID=A0AA37L6Y3_9PEZI|nr:uncharacterized protein ColSpa_01461 [Colletotrichum spaethianum]GKT41280.1 hypothetical protein ColSpa_01461 [Colletotrichum spaethianum]
MNKRLFLLGLLACLGDAFALQPDKLANGLPTTYCFTYLSTFLELGPLPTGVQPPGSTVTVIGGTTVTIPGGTVSIPGATVTVIGGTTVTIPGSTISTIPSVTTATSISLSAASSTTSSVSTTAPVARPVIFFVSPQVGGAKRDLQKRDLGGFVNHDVGINRESCNAATVFYFFQDQLLDAGNPIFYNPGETFKPLRNAGVAPSTAFTKTFVNVGGVLRFINSGIPGGQATFCQDPTGQVFITFNGRPAGCQTVLLYAYGLRQRPDCWWHASHGSDNDVLIHFHVIPFAHDFWLAHVN